MTKTLHVSDHAPWPYVSCYVAYTLLDGQRVGSIESDCLADLKAWATQNGYTNVKVNDPSMAGVPWRR